MDKKKDIHHGQADDLKGFEEFIDHLEPASSEKTPRHQNAESITFLLNDHVRLQKVAALLSDTLPVIQKYSQGEKIIANQLHQNAMLRDELFALLNSEQSPLHKTLSNLWNGFFNDQQT